MNAQKDAIINIGIFYIKEGQQGKFNQFKSLAGALLEEYGARIERVIKPSVIAKGELETPTEVHFAYYPSLEVFNTFNQDPRFMELRQQHAGPSIAKMFGFQSKQADFHFTREVGDATKTFGTALIYYKEGEENAKQFAEYHYEACKILPEFGVHFERFLEPFAVQGDLKQPNEIHRFYFDAQDGMTQMVTDERMQKLFPKRDNALSNLIFILGDALQ